MYRRNISGESGWWGWGRRGDPPGGTAQASGHVLDIPPGAAAESSGEEEEEGEEEGSAPPTWENIVAWQRGETDTIRGVATAAEEAEGEVAEEGAAAVVEEAGGGLRRATLPHHASVRAFEGSGEVVVQVEGVVVAVRPGVAPQRRQRSAAEGARAGAGGGASTRAGRGASAGAGGGENRGAAAAHAAPDAAPSTTTSGGMELGEIVVESNDTGECTSTTPSVAAPAAPCAFSAAPTATAALPAAAATLKADEDDGERYCRICLEAGAILTLVHFLSST